MEAITKITDKNGKVVYRTIVIKESENHTVTAIYGNVDIYKGKRKFYPLQSNSKK